MSELAICPECGALLSARGACPRGHDTGVTPPAPIRRRRPSTTAPLAMREGRELLHVTADAGTVAVREASDAAAGDGSDGRTISGVAVPWGSPTRRGATAEYGARREAFARGAFARAIQARGERPFPVVDRHHDGRVVGGVRFVEADDGLRYEGRLLSSSAASELAEQAREGLIGPSIEFLPERYAERGDLVTHTDVALLGALAFTYRPAYAGSVAVREDRGEGTMRCQHCNAELVPGIAHVCATQPATPATTAEPTPAQRAAADPIVRAGGGVELGEPTPALIEMVTRAADEAVRRQTEGSGWAVRDRVDPLMGYQSLGHLIQAASQDGASAELRGWCARALSDITYESGANAGAVTANTFGPLRRLVELGRPAITAFGGPHPLFGVGGTFGFPYYDGTLTDLVAEQTTQKSEIESATVDIKRATATIKTYAGGADIAFQILRRAEPGYLEMWWRIMTAAWAAVTDAAFVTALEAGSVTGDFAEALASVDATELKNLFVDASVAVQLATGVPAEFVLAGTNAFKATAKLLNPLPVFNAPGSANARTLEVNVSGLPVIHVPSMTTAKFIASNTAAAGWHEEGPFQASSDDVAKLGRDVAIWSMGAPGIYVPAGVIEIYDVSP